MRFLTLVALFSIQDVLAHGLNVSLDPVPESYMPMLGVFVLVAIVQDFKELFK